GQVERRCLVEADHAEDEVPGLAGIRQGRRAPRGRRRLELVVALESRDELVPAQRGLAVRGAVPATRVLERAFARAPLEERVQDLRHRTASAQEPRAAGSAGRAGTAWGPAPAPQPATG